MHMVLIICNLRKAVIISFLYYTFLSNKLFDTFEESPPAFKHVCPFTACAQWTGNNLKQIDI